MRLVVVGGGPLCTYALERLAALLPTTAAVEDVEIAVVERSGRFGAGAVHSDVQPATSMMNRVAGQIALGADETIAAAGRLPPRAQRPTFLEWAQREGLALEPRDAPQRRQHGRALRASFDRHVARLRATDGVTVELIEGEAVDVAPTVVAAATRRFEVRLGNGVVLVADRVLFVTGHSSNRPAAGSSTAALCAACAAPGEPPRRFVRPAYPLERMLDEAAAPPGCRVGLLGLGLTAIDVALHLTEGRGGRFEEACDRVRDPCAPLTYVPSGREPAVLVGACPSGLPVSCRPDNAKAEAGAALDHVPEFFTRATVRALRRAVGQPIVLSDGRLQRQLDFDRHVFPLVVLEMAWVHCRTALLADADAAMRAATAPRVRAFLRGEWTADTGDAAVDWLLAPLEACAAPLLGGRIPFFDWRRAFAPLPAEAAREGESWRSASLEFLAEDLARAARGNLHDPVKAACDGVWRDLRGVLCEAVDRGGLSADSQRRFASVHLRHYNRLSNGAARQPMRKLLALARAGLLDLSLGPAPEVGAVAGAASFSMRGGVTGAEREVDVLVEARTDPFDAARDERPLHPALLRRGLTRLWRNPGDGRAEDFVPGALDLDERFHPREADGRVEPRLTFLGAPAEGLVYFGQTAARPHARSPVLEAVACWAREVAIAVAARARATAGAC